MTLGPDGVGDSLTGIQPTAPPTALWLRKSRAHRLGRWWGGDGAAGSGGGGQSLVECGEGCCKLFGERDVPGVICSDVVAKFPNPLGEGVVREVFDAQGEEVFVGGPGAFGAAVDQWICSLVSVVAVRALRPRMAANNAAVSGRRASSISSRRRYSCNDRPLRAARAASSSRASEGTSRIVIDGMHA